MGNYCGCEDSELKKRYSMVEEEANSKRITHYQKNLIFSKRKQQATTAGEPSIDEEKRNKSKAARISFGISSPNGKKSTCLEDFELKKLLGRGSFGKVLLVQHRETNKYYAMKILQKDNIMKKKQRLHTQGERKILAVIVCL